MSSHAWPSTSGAGNVVGPSGLVTDNSIVRFDTTTGKIIQGSGVIVDDANNISGINNLVMSGDFILAGNTITTTDLEVTDANITVNNNGNQATAQAAGAGITVEMSDATNVDISYDQNLASFWKMGEVGSEVEIVGVSFAQVLTNKTFDASLNTLSNVNTTHLASGVLDTDISTTSASHDTIPSALAVRTAIDLAVNTVNDASEIGYVNTTSGLAAVNVQTAIDEVEGRVDSAESSISTNATNISTNAGNIATNTGNISTNTGNIATNTSDIATNASAISTNAGNISTNTTNIATNTDNISTNTGNIATNTSDISSLQTTVGNTLAVNSIVSVVSNVTLTNKAVHLVSTASPRTLTLPPASTDIYIVIKDVTGQASTDNITIITQLGQDIDISSTAIVNSDFESITIVSDGSNFFII